MLLTKEHINPRILCNVLAPIFISGFLGNIMCILVFLRARFRTRSISVYFIALFFNDCLLLFISHVAKMLIFDASSSCWFNIYMSKFIDIISYREMIYRHGLAVLTYNTTYTQISMLIFMFMSIQRVRTFSSISYRESRMCALMLTLIAFVFGIVVSYVQLYGAFCIKPLNLTTNQTLQIDLLINNTKYSMDTKCFETTTTFSSADEFSSSKNLGRKYRTIEKCSIRLVEKRFILVVVLIGINSTKKLSLSQLNSSSIYSISTYSPRFISANSTSSFSSTSSPNNSSIDEDSNSMCYTDADWSRIRHRTIAYVYLQSYMSIDWPDQHAVRSTCRLESTALPEYLRNSIHNLTWPSLQSRPGKDYFHEHQFCTQAYHYIHSYTNCSFPLAAETFQRWYKFLYDRRLSLTNRYTLGFIVGTFIPSCICIISSFICLYYIFNRPAIRKHSHSRAELRSLSLIFVEIVLSLMSALQSYIINFFTCHHLLFRMESDNCYGQSSNNILPNFLGSILELFTSTSNILILMICGSQFRNELVEILHLKRCCPKSQQQQQQQQQQQYRLNQSKTNRRRSKNNLVHRMTLSSPSSENGNSKTNDIAHDPSVDSLIVSFQNREDMSVTEIEQQSEETSQTLPKATTV